MLPSNDERLNTLSEFEREDLLNSINTLWWLSDSAWIKTFTSYNEFLPRNQIINYDSANEYEEYYTAETDLDYFHRLFEYVCNNKLIYVIHEGINYPSKFDHHEVSRDEAYYYLQDKFGIIFFQKPKMCNNNISIITLSETCNEERISKCYTGGDFLTSGCEKSKDLSLDSVKAISIMFFNNSNTRFFTNEKSILIIDNIHMAIIFDGNS